MRRIFNFLVLIFILICYQKLTAEPFTIIYTSNINGAIQNCGCGVEPLGGIGRIKYTVDQIRKEHKNVIFIDGGDYFNSYPYPLLNNSMLSVLKLLQIDVMVAGDQEYVEGKSFYDELKMDPGNQLLANNLKSENQKPIKLKAGSITIKVYGLLSPEVFEFIEKPDNLKIGKLSEKEWIQPSRKNFDIVVLHGYLEEAIQLTNGYSFIDLVLLSHDQRKGIWNSNGAVIVGNGKDSEYISVIKMNGKNSWKFGTEFLKINESIPENEKVLKIIEEFHKNSTVK